MLALSACGPDDIASPGTGGNVTINYPETPAPTPAPTSPTPTGVVAATGCPTINDPQGLTDAGTITGPTGSWRVCTLPSVIRASSTLPRLDGVLYQMAGRVDVGCDGGFTAPSTGAPYATSTVGCPSASLTADTNVTLTIEPGVTVYSGTGQSWLAVNRGNKINAVGTKERPIVFTSRDNVLGLNSDTSHGQWGGIVLLGRAKTTDCVAGTVAAGTCERQTEGAPNPARYGGNDDTYNAGRMSFVQIRYSGFVLSGNSELQALTTESIGSDTVLDHIQSHNSSDDGVEFFGGKFNLKHLVVTGADDDSLDVDTGARVDIQHALLLQRPGLGDGLLEIDSNGNEGDTPRTHLRLANFTAVQNQVSSNNESNAQASLLIRGNSDVELINGLIVTPNNQCIRMHGSGGANAATLSFTSVLLTCSSDKFIGSGTYTAASVSTLFNAGTNNNDAFASTLTGLFINGTGETNALAANANAISSFFDTTTYVGGAASSGDKWWEGWTCNSSYANFGTSNTGSCTSLPVYTTAAA